MDTTARLLIMSCSRTKRPTTELLPAINRYDGPAFKVLNRFLRQQPDAGEHLDVFILSAAYGLIPSQRLIRDYDHVMTTTRACELRDELQSDFGALAGVGYSELCLSMSQTYLQALDGWQAHVPSSTAVTITNGSQGIKLAQLKAWLWKDATSHLPTERKIAATCGEAHVRGVTLRLSSSEVIEHARAALADNRSGADAFREWYVQIDDTAVSVKWLVNRLTGVPVSAFTSREARRVLERLGLNVLGGVERR